MTEPVSWYFWQAYHHLRGSRQSGFGVGAIPFSEIMDYAERFIGIECPVQKSRLVRMVVALDNVEMEEARAG